MKKIKLFALNSSRQFGQEIASHLGMALSNVDEYYFDDGECYVAPSPDLKENVRGREVFVIESVYSDAKETINDKLMKLFILLGSLHDASAKRITVVTPYYPFARQDRKTSSRAPITTKYISRMFNCMWAKRMLTLDVHSPTALQNAYDIPVDLLEARNLFAVHVTNMMVPRNLSPRDVVILSPDIGGLPRATSFKNVMSDLWGEEVGIACMYKTHIGKEIKGHEIMRPDGGDIAGKSVIVYDDMISSGKTVVECCRVLEKKGAKEVLAVCATHGLFVGNANHYLDVPFLKNIVVTDTVKPFRITNPSVRNKLKIIKTTSLFAEAIKRIASDESISDLIANHLKNPSSS